jgi:hypothetical protein
MWILMVEAFAALFMLVFIVWWTMYSGKKPEDQEHTNEPGKEQEPLAAPKKGAPLEGPDN